MAHYAFGSNAPYELDRGASFLKHQISVDMGPGAVAGTAPNGGHGRTCCRLDPVAIDPKRAAGW
jgi:hypothetical protein